MTVATLADDRQTAIVRPATVDDAAVLARLIDIAGEGLPMTIWSALGA